MTTRAEAEFRDDPAEGLTEDLDELDELDLELAMDDDNYFVDDEDPGLEDESELEFEVEDLPHSYTARQRIEMALEDKWLKSAMADFDDIDGLEDFADRQVAGFSY